MHARLAISAATSRIVICLRPLLCCGLLAWVGTTAAAEPRMIFECSTWDFEKRANVYAPSSFLALSDDGSQLAAAGDDDGEVAMWDLPEPKPARYLKPKGVIKNNNTDLTWELAFFPNEKNLAALCWIRQSKGNKKSNLKLQLWDTVGGKSIVEWDAPIAEARGSTIPFVPGVPQPSNTGYGFWHDPTLAISRDGGAVGADVATEVFTYKTGSAAFFNSQSTTIITSWDVAAQRPIASLNTDWGIAPFTFTPDGKKVAVWDGNVRRVVVRDLNGRGGPLSIADFSEREWYGDIFKLAYSVDGKRLLMLCSVGEAPRNGQGRYSNKPTDIRLFQWNVDTTELAAESEVLPSFKKRVAMNDDATVFAVAVDERTIKVFDTATNKESAAVHLPDDEKAESLAFDRHGRYLAAGSSGILRVWDLAPAAETR